MCFTMLFKRRIVFGALCVHRSLQYECTFVCTECANAYGDDGLCAYWAMTGECVNNVDFMMKYCHKACSRCDANSTGISLYSVVLLS